VPPSRIDLVSVHATATPFNDAAEARALRRLFEDRVVPIFPLKGVIGHTLGAAGVLESLATWDALRRGVLPAVGGSGSLCEEARVWLPDVHTERPLAVALKLSAAFGGANAALVLGAAGASTPGSRRPLRPVGLAALGPFVVGPEPELVSRLSRAPESALSRLDGLSELTVAASARLLASLGSPPGARTAVVVGTQSATLEANDLFDRRRREGHAVEPRRFPATSPNLCAGWCSIAFGWTGPSLSVASADAASEAMRIGYDLVAAGDAEAAVIVAAEDAGPAVRELSLTAGRPVPPRGAQALLLVPTAEGGDLGRARLVWPGLGPERTAGR
jgi:3-oxoacyl-[acyl-carrier-protein] synthase-1/3-oxoacyl-[acyl-carrier-protein] synthase II